MAEKTVFTHCMKTVIPFDKLCMGKPTSFNQAVEEIFHPGKIKLFHFNFTLSLLSHIL